MKKSIWFLIICVTVLCGCNKEAPQEPMVSPTATEMPKQPTTQPTITPEETEDGTKRVSTVEELLEAIEPGSTILIEPGYYNLSDVIEKIWANEGENWNQNHSYVQIRECFDGVELVIFDVTDISISGATEQVSDTEIVVDPRYANVLSFEDCSRVNLSFLTMGHTDRGDCAGNVLGFYRSKDINLSNMDLYGCGVFGIGAYEATGDLSVFHSIIRDCTYGPFEFMEGNGTFEFRNCSFTGSDGGGIVEITENLEVAFYECVFGEKESNTWYFREDAYKEDCIWSEITAYPDFEY